MEADRRSREQERFRLKRSCSPWFRSAVQASGASVSSARALVAVLASAALLLWPALLNGYPIVFADTGTYLSQAIHRYVGWDRPVFYSLFLFPLHLRLSVWPVVVVQAILAAYLLHLTRRVLRPRSSPFLLVLLTGALSLASPLPWLVCQLMPDVFTPLLVLTLALLGLAGGRLSNGERLWLAALAAFMTTTHLSHLPLAVLTLVVIAVAGRRAGSHLVLAVATPLAAALALIAVNLAAHGRAAVSPYGNVFVLARVLYDGAGMAVLRHRCPDHSWRLCPFLDRFPPSADEFLWRTDSPIILAGGHKLVSADAGAIVGQALREHPAEELSAALHNWAVQLASFATGDGLQPWPSSVTPWIERDFPAAEQARYRAARQTAGTLSIPGWMQALHRAAAVAGIGFCLFLLVRRRRDPAWTFAAVALFALTANAAITGMLSAPHDRYQSRIVWLPAAVALLAWRPSGIS